MASRVIGVKATQRNLLALMDRLGDDANSFLAQEAKAIYDKSQQYVPRDVGDLARSGQISSTGGAVSKGVGRSIQPRNASGQFARGGITVSYGRGLAEDYALTVHEYSSKHDPPTWQGKAVHFTTGGPQYLSRAFKERIGNLWSRLAASLRGKLR